MTKHKHAELIKAKADNMDLAVFFSDGAGWQKSDSKNVFPTSDSPQVEYFLCHPKHADVCLHWLNGGEVDIYEGENAKIKWTPINIGRGWNEYHPLMSGSLEFRIKPHNEKRWIATDGTVVKFVERDAIYPDRYQLIEIEVEV